MAIGPQFIIVTLAFSFQAKISAEIGEVISGKVTLQPNKFVLFKSLGMNFSCRSLEFSSSSVFAIS